jgi:hypothetical protein
LGYKLEFSAPVNGRVGRVTVTALDAEGRTRGQDEGKLTDAGVRAKVSKRFAARLGVAPEELSLLFEEEWAVFWDKARQHQKDAEAGSPEAAPGPHGFQGFHSSTLYRVEGNQTFRIRHSEKAGDYPELLANFAAKIVGEDVIDDGGGEVRHIFRVEGTLHTGERLPDVDVPAAEFAGMAWVPKAWGCRANPAAGPGARDHLRAAIQESSGSPHRRVIYRHTGWRRVDDLWYFLHAGGGIGAAGANPAMLVQLDGPLANYRLPDPPEGDALVEAVRASIALLDDRALAPQRVMFPLVGAVYRPPLGKVDSSLHAAGPTGGGKSEWAALGQQHYGPDMDRLNLPANWSSTPNSLEEAAFLAKDVPLTIDDFKPGGSKHEIDQWHSKADRVFRAQGNGSGRGRCRPDGTPRPVRPPRGLILSTGEDSPRGESLQARIMPVMVNKGDINIGALTPHQRAAAQGLYAAAMSSYVRHLAADYDAIQSHLPGERAALRTRALGEFTSAHARVAGAVADLYLGLKCFVDFALHVGAIDQALHEALCRQGWEALLEAARQQSSAVAGQDPARRFLRLVSTAITSGRAHLVSRPGGRPARPASWGWRRQKVGTGQYVRTDWRAQGSQIGWVDGKGVYLDPDAAYAEVQRLGEDQGERLPLTQAQLYRRLKDGGHLAAYEKERTVRRLTIQGEPRFVLHLRPGTLSARKL